MLYIIVCFTIIVLAIIAAHTIMQYKDFREQEHTVYIQRTAINENSVGGQNFVITERGNNNSKREHRHTPKFVQYHTRKWYKNCQ